VSESGARKLLGRSANSHLPDAQFTKGQSLASAPQGLKVMSQKGRNRESCIQDDSRRKWNLNLGEHQPRQ
jgi:hypothetical protein